MRHLSRFLFCLLVLCLSTGAYIHAQNAPYAEELSQFRTFVKTQMAADQIPGLSIGFRKGDHVWMEGFGYADLEHQAPAKPETSYRMASVGKPMTAFGILKLVETGKLDLDAEVQTYVPYFPQKAYPVSTRLLLGHLGGISHYQNYDLEGHFKDQKDTRAAIAVFEDFDLIAAPGTRYNYSSYGYNLLGAVIEGASGETYGDYMRRVLWGPLGMENTIMDHPDVIVPNRARGYRPGPDGKPINSEFVNISSRFAAGGIRSTVPDLLNLAKSISAGAILSDSLFDVMTTSMSTTAGRNTGYGMGWGVDDINGRFMIAHSGAQAETRTYFMVLPKDDFAMAILTNYEGADRMPYVRRLYQLIMKESWPTNVYATNASDQPAINALDRVYENGLAYYDKYQAPMSSDEAVIKAAFSYFKQCTNPKALKKEPAEVERRIREGSHPAAGSPFVGLGSYMAYRIHEGLEEADAEALHKGGAISFFDAYRQLKRSRTYRFDRSFEKKIESWQKHWASVWTPNIQQLYFTPDTDLEALALNQSFAGASVYPDFSNTIATLAETRYQHRDLPGAMAALDLAMQLYPRKGRSHALAGIGHLVQNQPEEARAHLKQAFTLEPNGAGGPGYLNGFAYNLKATGWIDVGLALLQIAAELHPQEANLYDSIGEFYLEKGDLEAAIASYEKALEIMPTFENAKRMLEQIRGKQNVKPIGEE